MLKKSLRAVTILCGCSSILVPLYAATETNKKSVTQNLSLEIEVNLEDGEVTVIRQTKNKPPKQKKKKETQPVSKEQTLKKPTEYKALLEAKIACFFPTSSKINQIYGAALPLFGLEANIKTYKGLYRYFNASYLWQSGHSMGKHNRTEFELVPLGVGLKYIYDLKSVSIYGSAGPLLSYVHMKDSSSHVIQKSHKWSWGGNAKFGVLYTPIKHLVVDAFLDYSYMNFDFHNGHGKVIRTNTNFSGLSIGAAIGYAF